MKIERTRRAFHTVNIRPCATSALQILFDPNTESKFRFVAICIERQRESKKPPPCPRFPFSRFRPRKRGRFQSGEYYPRENYKGEVGAQRARNSLCTRKCIKGENVIYRVHAQNSREGWSCVREGGVGGRTGCSGDAGMKGEFDRGV